MKKIGEVTTSYKLDQSKLKNAYVEALKDPAFKNYVAHLSAPEEVLIKYTSRLEDALEEYQHCQNCKGLSECKNKEKGFLLTPEMQAKTLSFSYIACPYLQKKLNATKYQENVYAFEIPKMLLEASLKDVYKDDVARKEIIKYIVSFIHQYKEDKKQKGLYLHGSFGSGKTYLIAALFNELAHQNVRSALIYYPEFLRSLKESFGQEEYKEKFEKIKKVPLLLLDDIGAENMTPWSRDEVLAPILQYRMEEGLPTFFTSNFTLNELENHLSSSSTGVEKVKARRIIERIRELTVEMQLVSKNRRS